MKHCNPLVLLWCALTLVACGGGVTVVPISATQPDTSPVLTSTSLPTTTVTIEPALQDVGPDLVDMGREAYVRTCAACHGKNAEGYANELASPALDSSEHASEHADQQIHDWIINGKLGLGREMPALGDQLDDREVHAVIAYLHSLWTPDQLAQQQDISQRWPSTPEPTWTLTP